MRPRLIVTRPAREAARWVQALQARGHAAEALPLIDIAPPLPGAGAPPEAGPYAALMFVSAPAVEGYLGPDIEPNQPPAPENRAPDALEKIANSRCWAPGPGTARALARAGVPAARIDQPAPEAARLDSEALWAQVAPQVCAGTRVLLLRGADAEGRPQGRDWLASAIEAAGGTVDSAVVYRRLPPRWSADQARRARAATGDPAAWWVFSSALAVRHLQAALPEADWRGAHALATHPRIAEAARAAGFGRVITVPPRLEELLASIESIG